MKWSEKELEYIENNFYKTTIKEIAKNLNRTLGSVETKLRRLGFIKKINREFNKIEGEIWKDINGFENKYKISNFGRIISKKIEWNLLSLCDNGSGYKCVALSGKNKYIHRLVAEAFIENKYNLNQINHKNEIKSDNKVENLEWCNQKYNNNYGTKNKRSSEKKSKKIIQIKNNEIVNIYNSISSTEKK